jgi:hypothetical protein
MDIGCLCHLDELFLSDLPIVPVGYVGADCIIEKHWLLAHQSHLVAEPTDFYAWVA